jgi:hypothetical protein
MAKRTFFTGKTTFRIINILVILALAGAAGYYFKKYDDLKNSTPEKVQQAQTDQYIKEVGKLYSLPKNEKPTVGKVSDKEAIKKQYPVLDQVENGDVLIIYQDSKIALLYRPSTKKLIKVIPVSVSESVKIKVIGKEADRAAVEKALTDSKLEYSKGDPKTALTGITIVDVKGTNAEQAKKLAEIAKGQVGTLPAGEDQPTDVDLVVYVGTVTP